MPLLSLLVVFQTLRRASNVAVSRPAREVLFAVLRREDKYKAKSFMDTFVYRAGDQIGAWSYPLLTWLGLGLTGISFVARAPGRRMVRAQSLARAAADRPGKATKTGRAVRPRV